MTPLISDLRLELDTGQMIVLPSSFGLPVGLTVDAGENGDRAPGAKTVVRSGDELGGQYTLTGMGILQGSNPEEVCIKLNTLSTQLRQTRKIWRSGRYLKVHYGLLPPADMGLGWLSASVTPVFRLAYLSWLKPVYVAGIQIGEEEVYI